jgi:hypothetical protein
VHSGCDLCLFYSHLGHTHSHLCLIYSHLGHTQGLIQRPALVAEFLSGCSLDSAIVRGADFLGSDLVLAKIALDAARVGFVGQEVVCVTWI